MKKVVYLLIALLIASTCCSCCSSEETIASETETETAAAEIETEEERMHTVPADLDFSGDTFTVCSNGWGRDILADVLTGDTMNDALYNRQQRIEEDLNITFVNDFNEKSEGVVDKVKKSVAAGEDAYQLAQMHCILSVAEFASGGYLYNWDNLPYVDYSADWWNKSQMDALRLGKNTYYGIGDFNIPSPYCIFFNKDMIKDYSLENPYTLVYEGTWTLDTFRTMVETVVEDVDGDGLMTKDDQYGITGVDASLYISFMTGAGQFITERQGDGKFNLCLNTEKTIRIVETFTALSQSGGCYPKKLPYQTLDTGNYLFEMGVITAAEIMRDYEVDFGFLPYPKYDEKQETYLSMDWGELWCIPSTLQKTELTGATLELLSFYSAEEVLPTYYYKVLTGKLSRDEDSVKMLDIIFDTICYEVGGNYFGFSSGFTDLFYTIPRLCFDGDGNFASFYAKNEKMAVNELNKFYEALEKIETVNN